MQYQILIASVLMLLGCTSSGLEAARHSTAVHLLASDASTEEGSGSQLPRSHDYRKSQDPGASFDKLTGKRIIRASVTENLYLPGHILHITARKAKR